MAANTLSPSRIRNWRFLALKLVIAAVLPASAAVGCFVFWTRMLSVQENARTVVRQREEARAVQTSQIVGQQFEASFRSIDVASRHLSFIYAADRPHFNGAVDNMLAAYPPGMIQFITVFNPDGYLAYTSSGKVDGSLYFRDREHFRRPATNLSDELFVSRPIVGRISGIPVVQITRAIRSGGKLLGVLGIPVRPDFLSTQLASIRSGPSDILSIERVDGTPIARSIGYSADTVLAPAPTHRPYEEAPPGEAGTFRALATDGGPRLFAWRRMQNWPLVVTAAVDEEGAIQSLATRQSDERYRDAWTVVAVMSFAALMAFLALRQFLQQAKVAESERMHRRLFNDAYTPILIIDPAGGTIVGANRAAVNLYGYPEDSLIGMPISAINRLPADEVRRGMRDAVREYRDTFQFEHRLASGEIRQVEVHSTPVDVGGRTVLHSIVHDVTDRIRLEQKVVDDAGRLAAILATASDGIHVLDSNGVLVQYSESFARMLGREGESLAGLSVRDWDCGIDDGRIGQMLQEFSSGSVVSFETRHRRKDGTIFDVEIYSRGFLVDGKTFIYNSSRDISDRKLAEKDLRVAAIAFDVQEGLIITNEKVEIQRVNKAFTAITGYSEDEVIGRNPSFLQSGRQPQTFYHDMWYRIAEKDGWEGEVWSCRKSGEVYPEWLSIKVVRDEAGTIVNYVGSLTDITARKHDEQEIRNLAFFDPLTQLANRRLLLDRLEQALSVARRSGGSVGLLFIDLDHFKTINDHLGHEVGDQFLKLVAERLSACAREEDTVARLGGDEFVVLLDSLSSTSEMAGASVEVAARRIITELNRAFTINGSQLHTSPSIGAVVSGGGRYAAIEMLKHADMAMYQSKQAGRNTLRFFDTAMQAAADRRAIEEKELRLGLEGDEFCLHYQPQALADGTIYAVEALARWMRDGRAVRGPADFIHLAEQIGVIARLGRMLFRQACALQACWRGDQRKSRIVVAINISAIQFQQSDFVDQVLEDIQTTGANPERIKLEITESLLLTNIDEAISKMKRLAGVGVRFSIDDFGTGYSSLFYLKRLPLSQLKIDRSFVRELPDDKDALAIASMVLALAQQLGLDVVAEGTENREQVDCLAELGCTRFQGYYFSHPLDREQLEQLLDGDMRLPAH